MNIRIVYWHGVKFKNCPYDHNQLFDYTKETLHEIIDTILECNLNSMVINHNSDFNKLDTVYVWIDNGRFRQH